MRILGYIFYSYIWVLFRFFLGFFYRHRVLKHAVGFENIPKGNPVLFCSNHPNAFMDAQLLGSSLPRRTWFLARSDAFRKKWLANALGFVGLIPIYRMLEGAENLSKNDETFDKCAELLSENKAIMVFSEGLCIQERRLRKLKKGTARIAFSSEEKKDWKLGLQIIPVGINYSGTPWKFRSRAHIRFGKPINVKEYKEIYENDKARAMNMFTRDLEKQMAQLILIIDDPKNDELVFQLEQMFLKKWAVEEYLDPNNQTETHRISREITHLLKACEKWEPNRIDVLREKVGDYSNKLKFFRIRDWVVAKSNSDQLNAGEIIFNYLIFLLFAPIWLFGLITNYIPYKIPTLVTKKVIKNIEWVASVNATIGVFLWQVYWLLQSLVIALIFRNWYLLVAFMLAVPITGVIAQELFVLLKKTNGMRRFLFSKNKSGVEEIKKTRMEIVGEMELLKESFPLKDV